MELKRVLSRWDSIAIGIGIVIGVGIFRVPAEIAQYLSYPPFILFAWILGGSISLIGAFCYAELSSSFPETGGNYIYLRNSYGSWVGFLFGWTELIVVRAGSIAAIALIFSEYFRVFLGLSNIVVKPGAVLIILLLSVLNMRGLVYGKGLQTFMTWVKLAALVIIVFFGLFLKKGNLSHFFEGTPEAFDLSLVSSLGLSLIPILWTYGGWHESVFVAGETRNAEKSLPFVLIVTILMITLIYAFINILYIYLLPVDKIANAPLIASDVFQILFGKNGQKCLDLLIIIYAIGCINAMIITGSRITYAMARDHRLFRYLGEEDPKFGTPLRSIGLNALWAIGFVLLGTFEKLLFFTGAVVWLFFALVGGSLIILRRKFPQAKRPFSVPLYPWVPWLFVIICSALFLNTIIFYPVESLIGLAIMFTGIPVFMISNRKKRDFNALS
jgi:amino acid transporter